MRIPLGRDAYLAIVADIVQAYVPKGTREDFKYTGYTKGVEISLKKKKIHGLEWEVVNAGYRVKKGYAYRVKIVSKAKEDIIEAIIKDAEKIEKTKETGKIEGGATAQPSIITTGTTHNPPEETQPEEAVITITTSGGLSTGTEGVAYSQALSVSGGASPYAWNVVSGSLPTGLSLSSNGIISGTPVSGSAGSYSFNIRVTDIESISASKQFSLTINPGTSNLTITTSSLPDGTEGSSYSQTLSASGGVTPYTWSISSGTLPSGLSLSNSGVISGTPAINSRGTHTFTVKVIDSNSNSAVKELSIKIGYYKSTTQAVDDYVWTTSVTGANVRQIKKSTSATTNFSTGANSNGVAVDDKYVWITNRDSNNVTRITKSSLATTNIPVGNIPVGIAVDETYAWVNCGGGIYKIEKENLATTVFSATGWGYGIAVDDTYLWAIGGVSGVMRINKSNASDIANIAAGDTPFGIAVDDTYVWVVNMFSDNVTRIEKSNLNTTTIPLTVDGWPFGIAVDDTYVWVTEFDANDILCIRKTDSVVVDTIPVWGPIGVSLDSNYVWVSNYGDGTVARITKSNTSLIETIPVGGNPYSIGDATGYSFDHFFYNVYVDPNITGRVYDSVTGDTISSPVISIYPKDSTTALSSTTNNPYSFNVNDGYYYLRVEKEGYTFPSNKVNGVTTGDHGENFYASGSSMGIDIPIDQGYPLEITKTANKKTVVNGDIVTYDIKIRNKSMWAFSNINIIDEITNGFRYVTESTYTDNTQLPEANISQSNRKMTYKLTNIPGYKETHLTYQVRVGSGISVGEYKTTAVAWDRVKDWRMSNETSCFVQVVADALFTLGTIIGKVFFDQNANGVQDRKKPETSNQKPEFIEVGIAGVRIATEYGVVVETDRDGKYHIPAVPPGTHLLKVDPASIPVIQTVS